MDVVQKSETLSTESAGPSHDARVGKLLDEKYRIHRKLAEGGMGAVYQAFHQIVGRPFAIKFLRPEFARDEHMMARFKLEARAAGSLVSENIAATTDFGVASDGAPYIVMEYLQGRDLRGLLQQHGRLPPVRITNLIVQVCRGLHLAHAAGIVHRDLKPENLFLVERGDQGELCKILDFGIARFRGGITLGAATKAGEVVGTLYYMSPEQARGDTDIDERADVYSLGAILYEALAGQLPHTGDDAHVILYRIVHKVPAPLDSICPGLPEGLDALVHRALAVNREDRFASVDELANALAPFAGRTLMPSPAELPVPAIPMAPPGASRGPGTTERLAAPIPDVNPGRPVSAAPTLQPTVIVPDRNVTGFSSGRGAGRRAGFLVAAAVVLGGVAVALTGGIFWPRGDDTPALLDPQSVVPAVEAIPEASRDPAGPQSALPIPAQLPVTPALSDRAEPSGVPVVGNGGTKMAPRPAQSGGWHLPTSPPFKKDPEKNTIRGARGAEFDPRNPYKKEVPAGGT